MIAVIPRPSAVDIDSPRGWHGRHIALVPCPEFAEILPAVRGLFPADIQVHDGAAHPPDHLTLTLEVGPAPEAIAPPQGISPHAENPPDERYRLQITEREARITAPTAVAAFRGAVTLAQLLHLGMADGVAHLPAATITDGPRYAWRGLSLDVVRHFFTVEQVCSVIDLIALYKFNALHLHLSDDEAWRLEIPSRPALTGAALPGNEGSYSAADFRRIVEYAQARLVTVVPEVDLPGHTGAVFRAYPDLTTCAASDGPNAAPWPSWALDPEAASTWDFVTDVLEHLSTLTPGRFLHLGCDEAWGMAPGAYADFVRGARDRVRALGKHPITWQEGARAGASPRDVVQHWIAIDPDQVAQQVREKYPDQPQVAEFLSEHIAAADGDARLAGDGGAHLILSPTRYAYLDMPYSEPAATPELEALRGRLGHPSYPGTTVAEVFDWDPATTLDGVAPERVAGVEAAIWGETLTSLQDLEFLLLPRLPGVAEKGWSAPGGWAEHSGRLAEHGAIWTRTGRTWFNPA